MCAIGRGSQGWKRNRQRMSGWKMRRNKENEKERKIMNEKEINVWKKERMKIKKKE